MLKQRGFSLTELMIGSTVGLLVIAGALQLYVLNLRATNDNLRLSRLNQELRATLDLLRNDLRRAGHWRLEPGTDAPTDNPFQAGDNDIRLGRATGEAPRSCILYSYDLNGDRQVGVGPSGLAGPTTSTDNLERFGMRLRAGQVQMRNGGAAFNCTSGSWQAVTDPDTDITLLRFESIETCHNLSDRAHDCVAGDAALLRRQIRIALHARSRSDPNIVQELTSTVAIANDKLFSAYP
ncbi:MAG: prepilin-type N-terminal cleavage/methylation domain-containing protein [Gammaproteobacteria bacterium]|nr:prepilin-type N-terminal cleavage/methylation domain-containing protein [Gammaproteobacteria bacterium]